MHSSGLQTQHVGACKRLLFKVLDLVKRAPVWIDVVLLVPRKVSQAKLCCPLHTQHNNQKHPSWGGRIARFCDISIWIHTSEDLQRLKMLQPTFPYRSELDRVSNAREEHKNSDIRRGLGPKVYRLSEQAPPS